MYKGIELYVIFLYFHLIGSVAASYCYPDYCQNLTVIVPTPGFQCLLTPIQRSKDCVKLKFDGLGHTSPKHDTTKFQLSAYVKNFGKFHSFVEKATAFNLSVTDINFHRLVTRYQNLADENLSACRHIELYGNDTYPAPNDLYVSCPFSDDLYEGTAYRLEYLVTGKDFEYSKKFVFIVPHHDHIDTYVDVKTYTPFIYVDVSDTSSLSLYIQPLPEKFNVTKYKIRLIKNGTDSVTDLIVPHTENNIHKHLRHDFIVHDGVYYFEVAGLHPNCSEYGCSNSTSPFISIKQVSHRLLIMIISIIWIPPVILYVLYHMYKLYKRKQILKRIEKQPNCLIMYSPTHTAHVNVMANLTKYLRCCNINAMIDMFDVPETPSKDPGLWCDTAFHCAEVVLVATSPPSGKTSVPVIYQNTDNHILRLLKENYPHRNKRYYVVQFPYCKSEDIPEEARYFKRFHLPKDLAKLVKVIHGVDCVRLLNVTDAELVDAISTTKIKIAEDEVHDLKSEEETEDLLPVIVKKATLEENKQREIHEPDMPEIDVIPKTFGINIDELNLLGESGEGQRETVGFNPATKDCEFRIDKLEL